MHRYIQLRSILVFIDLSCILNVVCIMCTEGNEPDHQTYFLYAYITASSSNQGSAWKVQQYVHEILSNKYSSSPQGLSGQDDAGQMYVLIVCAGRIVSLFYLKWSFCDVFCVFCLFFVFFYSFLCIFTCS